ncbi:MAG: type II toxin-antitoxin system RelE/ParE family toxin [Clostridiales bacterium]|jgi:mRNA interferase RelE/StbE|nr:type II toxin-antitoxin system RelE/ParE family toxin [Clostridiales bacterium]
MNPPIYSKQAAKVLNGLDKPTQQRIRQSVAKIPDGDIKPLQGYTEGHKRLRIGKYRIVFKTVEKELFILEIGSRGDIYK